MAIWLRRQAAVFSAVNRTRLAIPDVAVSTMSIQGHTAVARSCERAEVSRARAIDPAQLSPTALQIGTRPEFVALLTTVVRSRSKRRTRWRPSHSARNE